MTSTDNASIGGNGARSARGIACRHSGLIAPKSASADFGKYVADLGSIKPEIGGAPE
jgi:hypothetical protein